MSITSDLEKFYDSEAKKYHQTRQKHWSDAEMIISALKSLITQENPNILELGCGGGRGISLLNEQYHRSFSYTGVDISSNLLAYAKKDNPKNHFVHADMNQYLRDAQQESVDVVIACASFQHIPDEKGRIAILKNIFRVLKYDGIIIFTNRACSEWFLKTHWKPLALAGLKSLITFGKTTRRDVMIPRTGDSWKQYRYYHLFSLDELKKLTELSGLTVKELHYLDRKGEVTDSRKNANNSFLMAKKTIYK